MRYFTIVLIIFACASTCAFCNAQEASSPVEKKAVLSPDEKWEYKPATSDQPAQVVRVGTNQSAGDLACDASNCGDGAKVLWAPDSKRLAFNWGQGRTHQTSLYQLRNGHWVALKVPGDNDEIEKRSNEIMTADLKSQGLSEKKLAGQGKYLRFISSTVEVDRWLDPNTAIVYASERRVVARRDDPGEMDDGCGSDVQFTLRFEKTGKWKIAETHKMSDKEVEKRDNGQ